MLKVTVHTDVSQALLRSVSDIDQRMAELLQEIGTQLLSLQKQDFEKKSRGGSGVDGTTWKPLTEATERRKALKKVRKNKVRKDGTRKRRQLKGAVPKSQIGVDTGLMRDCATPGFSGVNPDNGIPGVNILEVRPNSVVVGYGVEYADYFDEVRPLMPNTLPAPWEKSIETIIDEWAADILKNNLN